MNELRTEAKIRSAQIYEMKEREVVTNYQQVRSKVQASPFKQLEERRRKLINESRHQYLLRLAMNY